MRIESNHTLNIEAFVDEGEVDVIYQDAPYYLAPDGAMAEETFVVLREAMRKTGKVAIARLVLSSRERVVTIGAARERHVRLHAAQPERGARHRRIFRQHPGRQARPEMLQLAEKLIEQKVTEFDPKNYEDRYEVALMEMIKEKLKGHKPIIAAAPERGNVINLMDALKASLGQAKPPAKSKSKAGRGRRRSPPPRPPPRGGRQGGRPRARSDGSSPARPSASSGRSRPSRGGWRRARSSGSGGQLRRGVTRAHHACRVRPHAARQQTATRRSRRASTPSATAGRRLLSENGFLRLLGLVDAAGQRRR